MNSTLSRDVQMQFLRPSQLAARMQAFPAVYVPFGLIEWHGRHLPLGNDAIKAHAFAVKTAEAHGGVVYPPVYFHCGFDRINHVITELFERLRSTGFRVIIGISGHNTQGQLNMMQQAVDAVERGDEITVTDSLHRPKRADDVRGLSIWEISLSEGEESGSDHAAKWETSNMMFFYPDTVDLGELGDGPLTLNQTPPDGIGGPDPREHASAETGRRNVEIAVEAIGRNVRELLESLPADQRDFPREEFTPDTWWQI